MTDERGAGGSKHLYIFLDEGGNFDFSPSGTTYFTLTSVAKARPFQIAPVLDDLKYDLIETGLDIEYFHATEDRQAVRNRVYASIQQFMDSLRIDSLVVEKRKTGRPLRDDLQFYPRMIGYLLKYVLKSHMLHNIKEVIVITDTIPLNKKRNAVEKAIKTTLKHMLPRTCTYRVMHHASKSTFGLQVADYCNWAIYRKWEKGDTRSYELIKPRIMSEFDIFKEGAMQYY